MSVSRPERAHEASGKAILHALGAHPPVLDNRCLLFARTRRSNPLRLNDLSSRKHGAVLASHFKVCVSANSFSL